MKWIHLATPLDEEAVRPLRAGDAVLFSGALYVARDRAHERLRGMIDNGEGLPFDPRGQVIYFMGPSPAPPGRAIGSAGPTTSYRMDPFTETMCDAGIKGFIGKGKRSAEARAVMMEGGAVYFSSFGGAGAYLARRIVSSEVLAFAELGPEAVYRIEVVEFPAILINDIYGGDLYENELSKRR